jgi:hypothetical protein
MANGIYTLANDVVYDQLIALLNSIEANVGSQTPVAVIAYDEKTERVREALTRYPNVNLLDDPDFYAPWERFSYDAWATHQNALQIWAEQGIQGVNRLGMNRRYAAFDNAAPFERFVYLDADTLVLSPLDKVFEALQSHRLVVYDFQFKDITHIFNDKSPKLSQIFPAERTNREIFCAGFYAGQRGLFPPEDRAWLVEQLASGESDVLYMSAPNQSLLNYMVMRCQVPVHNLALTLPPEERTGNSVTSPHFEAREGSVLDQGYPLTYMHYIGVSSKLFRRLCQGENMDIPYRDVFLHYRYLHAPEARPRFTGPKVQPQPSRPPLWKRALNKLKL